MTWATSTGNTIIVASLTPTAAEYDGAIVQASVSYGLIKVSFSGAPDLSSVLTGHRLTIAGFTNADNNGTFVIYEANNTDKTITYLSTIRTSNSLDETGISGTGSVSDSAAIISEPSAAKRAQGWIDGEKPSAARFNALFNDLYTQVASFAQRDDRDAWKAVNRTGFSENYEFIKDWGVYRYDPTSTLIADDETVLQPSAGPGRGILELAHPNAIYSYMNNVIGQGAYNISQLAELDFPSVAANSTQDLTVSVIDARPGNGVSVTVPDGLNAGLIAHAWVSADDVVTVRLTNITGGAIDPASGNFRIEVRKY